MDRSHSAIPNCQAHLAAPNIAQSYTPDNWQNDSATLLSPGNCTA
jgi:hypothetical protein